MIERLKSAAGQHGNGSFRADCGFAVNDDNVVLAWTAGADYSIISAELCWLPVFKL